VFRSSITVKIAYDGYNTEACGIDICHADREPGEKNSPITVGMLWGLLNPDSLRKFFELGCVPITIVELGQSH